MSRIDAWLILMAMMLGFCLARVSLCSVAAARLWMQQHRFTGVATLAVAVSASGVVLLTLNRLRPSQVMLPMDMPVTTGILLGGVLLGIGALINGGCYLGSVSYLGTGNLNFLFTLVGIALAARWQVAATRMPMAAHPLPVELTVSGLILFLAALVLAWRSRRRDPTAVASGTLLRGPWPWQWAAMGCGAIAAVLFAYSPNWTYAHAIEALARLDSSSPDWHREAAAIALFAGVTCGALLNGRFQWAALSFRRALRCLVGGAMMAFGASHIPGGNDALLLWSIPGLTLYGVLAYLSMLTTLIIAFWLARWIIRPRAPLSAAD